jgi:hypothetical protein
MFVAGVLIFAVATCSAMGDDKLDITGTYKQLNGTLTCIIRKNGDVYNVRWERRGENTVWIGIGLLEGKTFSTAWDFTNGGDLGLGVYKVERGLRGPRLVGRYASYTKGRLDRQQTADTLEFVRK